MVEAERLEKTEPLRSAALYREAIIGLLESAAEPLDHEGVRRDLLQIFDRLSVVLKRAGLPEEALEESTARRRSASWTARTKASRTSGGLEEAPGEPAALPRRPLSATT